MSARPTPVEGSASGAQLSLNDAQSYLATAADALNGWYGQHSTAEHTYVADGHETIHLIDELLRELHRVRSALIGEIRADEDERFARVDRLLAECRAAREAAGVAVESGRPEVRS